MRGAFGQDPEFARKMAVERWRRYRIAKSMKRRHQIQLDLEEV